MKCFISVEWMLNAQSAYSADLFVQMLDYLGLYEVISHKKPSALLHSAEVGCE